MSPRTQDKPEGLTYADAGVDIAAGDRFAASIGALMRRTHGPRVIQNPGGFAGLLRLDYNEQLFKHNFKDPVLVACCDGVGTKLRLAIETRRFDTVGIDLVAMSVNDLVVQGAEPLMFLDYVAVHKVEQPVLADVLKGVARGCELARCALVGGETAEMSDMYAEGDLDLAGFAVGVVELTRATDPTRVEPGDVVLGLASSGLHSNGYTLVRRIVEHAGLDLDRVYPELSPDRKLADVLLEPTRIYADQLVRLQRAYKVKKIVTGMAHITGGGLEGNLCRALHPGVDAAIDESIWEVPAVFRFLQEHGGVDEDEMRRVFNMGIGYCLIVRPTFAESVARRLRRMGEAVTVIGTVTKGKGTVRVRNRRDGGGALMAGGREYTRGQKKIIDRYYEHHDTILAQRLGEIATDMALAAGDQKKLDRLWARAEQALAKSKVNPAEKRTVLEKRDLEGLGRLVSKLA